MEGEPPARSRVGFYSPQPRVSPFVYNFYYITERPIHYRKSKILTRRARERWCRAVRSGRPDVCGRVVGPAEARGRHGHPRSGKRRSFGWETGRCACALNTSTGTARVSLSLYDLMRWL